MPPADLQTLLQTTFGFSGFRASQQAVCEAAVAGRDVLLVMPTGAGKSLCYQLPALARAGTALVISPLIALMDDQAYKLEALGLTVGRIHSGMPREHSREVCRDYLDGKLKFLFIAPERFRVPGFGAMLAKHPLSLIAIDEAHCISQWGHDFRPDYRNLASHLRQLRPAPVVALTATATPQVQRDIVTELGLHNPAQFIQGFRRTNLAVEVVEISKPRRTDLARKLLQDESSRPAIVYAPSRKDAEALATELNSNFKAATYHAGLDAGTRERVQRAFLAGEIEVVVATIAFGMGIDKANVRTVLHMAMPASVESYYQEIGRAGRDGAPARTVLMYSFADRRMHDFFLDRDYPPADTLARIAAALRSDPVHADDLRIALKLDLDAFGPALDKLLVQGAAHIDFAGNVTRTADTAMAWRKGYDAQVSHRRGQIDAMMRFAEAAECRMAALLRHFGDSSDARRACGLCDVCAPECTSAQTFRAPTRDEEREMLRLLRALDGKGNGMSTGKLHTELYPRKEFERKEMDALLDTLSRAGYVSIESDTFLKDDGQEITYRRAMLTHEGRLAEGGEPLENLLMRDVEAVNAGRTRDRSTSSRATRTKERASMEDVPLTAAQKIAAANLRTWRAGEAKLLGKPAFVIFGDRVLHQLASDAPTTLGELQDVSGIGPAKAERWGEAILQVLGDDAQDSALTASQESGGSPAAPRVSGTTPPQRRDDVRKGRHQTRKEERLQELCAGLTPQQAGIARRLVEWRAEKAKALSSPAYVILDNQTLRAIAEQQPQNDRELKRVNDIYGAKVRNWGDEIVATVNGADPAAVKELKVHAPFLKPSLEMVSPAPSLEMPTSSSLDHSLQVWRMHEAKRLEKAPFDLLSNSTLCAIASAKPQTIRELGRVAGVGSRWAERHGDAVCAIIAQHLQANIHLLT